MPRQTSVTQPIIPGKSGIEAELERLAAMTFQQVYGDYTAMGGMDLAGKAAAPSLSPELMALINGAQEASLSNARQEMSGVYDDISRQVSEQASARGVLDSSFTPVALGTAFRGQAQNFANLASASQQQAAGQMVSGAFNQQNAALQMLQMRQQISSMLSDPGLLGRMMQFRLSSAGSRTTAEIPTDWAALFKGAGEFAGGLGLDKAIAKLF